MLLKRTLSFYCFVVLIAAAAFAPVEAQVPSYLPANGLVAWYPFNGDAANALGGAENYGYGQAFGATLVADRFSNPASAYYFDGDDYIRGNPSFFPTGARTISVWFSLDNLIDHHTLIGYSGNGCGTSYLSGINWTNSGQILVTNHCNVTTASTSNGYPTANTWHNLIITTGNGETKFYMNGALVYTAGVDFNGTTIGGFFFFGVAVGTNGLGPYTDANVGYLKGKLDDIGIWNRVLAAQEVQQVFRGLKTYYRDSDSDNYGNLLIKTDAASQPTGYVLDSSDCNDNNPNIHPGATEICGNGIDENCNGSDGVCAATLHFDGIDDYINISNNGSFNITNKITLECWVKLDNTSGDKTIISKFGDVPSDDSYILRVDNGKVNLQLNFGTWVSLLSSKTLSPNDWHHIAGVYDGSTMKIYIDGNLDNSIVKSGNIAVSSSTLKIGRPGYAIPAGRDMFVGALDEVRVWNLARSQAEIQSAINCEITTPLPGLIANYHFNQGIANDNNATPTVNILLDASGNNSTGTLTNFALTGSTSNWTLSSAFPRNSTCSVPVNPGFVDLAVKDVTSPLSEIVPGDTVALSWKVINVGTGASFTDWTERIYLQSIAGQNRLLLKQINFATGNMLDTGQAVSRIALVPVPVQFNIGDQGVFVVELVPGPSIHEAVNTLANNTGIQQNPWTVKKSLTLILSATQLTEGSTEGITATVTRTGSLAASLAVSITLNRADRLQVPVSIVIPAGQAGVSFGITAPDNNAIEGTINDTVQVTAAGFPGVRAAVTLIDNDKASLSFVDFPASITEGSAVTFKVATNLASGMPLQVFLTSANKARFPVPPSVTIAAGSLSADITVQLAQNSVPEADLDVIIQAGAANSNPVSDTIKIKDDDLPGLELILKTNLIAESAGLSATQATLRRAAGNNSAAFTANISASLPNTLILPASISLVAGENEKTFNIGVVDNSLADGDRKVAVIATVFIASCGCSAPPTSAGYVAASLTVSDNDGSALQLSSTQLTFPEGAANAGFLRITRNSATASALNVSLSTSDSTEATLPATAIIPAGETFIDVPITTVNDGIADGSQQVYFQATANGFSTGAIWILVTDLNKPDLQVPAVTVANTSIQSMAIFNYQFSIKNTGFATAPAGFKVNGYLSKDNTIDASDTLIIGEVLANPIPAGQTIQVLNAARMPDLPGQYKLLFKVNPDAALEELLYSNNTSQAVNLDIKPDYTATADISGTYFIKGTTVPVTGNAIKSNGTAATGVPLEVYIITNGLRRKISATTDATGHYNTQFVPLANEAGHYTAGACFPGLGDTTTQDAFDILGIRINNGVAPQFKITLGDTLRGILPVQNLSNQGLHNFSLVPKVLPDGVSIRFDTLASFTGNTTINLAYTVTGSALSNGNNFLVASLQAVANEGNIQKVDVLYYCQASRAYVTADITSINTKVSQTNGERLVEFRLVNKGLGATGNININLPQTNWLSSVTPKVLPSLATGDTAVVILKFLASADIPFNYPINSTIGISTQNGNSFSIPFSFEKVAETTGDVKITVTNQFTYYSDGAPNVSGAHVQVKNYFSGVVYADGYTNAAGIFAIAGIPEGKHRIIVEKEKHLPYSSTIAINPGDTVASTVFINYQAITFSWTVVPTAIPDQYDITLTSQFETNIPIPVVTIEMPDTMPELNGTDVFAFNVILTNRGLITARDVALNLPTTDPEYEFITNYTPTDLLSQQSIQVPIMMRRRTGPPQGGRLAYSTVGEISEFLGINPSQYRTMGDDNLPCLGLAGVVYWYTCNLTTGLWERQGELFHYGERSCAELDSLHPFLSSLPKVVVDPGVSNIKIDCGFCIDTGPLDKLTDPTPKYMAVKANCVECLKSLASAALGCLGLPLPDPIPCFVDFFITKDDTALAECLLEYLGEDYIEKLKDLFPLLDQIGCIGGILDAMIPCLGGYEPVEGLKTQHLQRIASDGNSNALKEIYDNLLVVKNGYQLTVKWHREYFRDLSLNDSWKKFNPLVIKYIRNLTTIPVDSQATVLAVMQGYDMQPSAIQEFFVRWNKSIQARNEGILEPNNQYPDIINWRLVKIWSDSLIDAHNYAVGKGYSSIDDMNIKSRESLDKILNVQQQQVCASVTVQFSQQLTMTREAFEGTLDIFNGHPTDKMDSLSVNIQVTDQNGVPSNGVFEIQTKSLNNLNNVTGTGAIVAQQTGTVKFLFIPEIAAAPQSAKNYNFGGSVRYRDPYAKAIVTLPLSSVQLTVNPSPNLALHYFMQRNILGDDPLTSPDIEPSVPAELAVMVENQGYGPAVNMTISSAQPKIVENEKGLAINFSLVGSNFQGRPTNFGVTDINFGTIPALQTRIGEWYFTSSLLGKFVSYDASVVHANSFGNPDLSLVKSVKLHELTKSIKAYGAREDGINDFLVNDIFDVDDAPDIIYFSQGNRTAKVFPAASGSFSSPVGAPSFTNVLTVTAATAGWNYIKLDDPGRRLYEIVSVTRGDGQAIPLNNAWLSFVTLPVSRPPVYENKFHFVDSFSATTPVTYTIVWKPKNLDVPKVDSITGVPAQGTSEQVEKLKVVFSKPIDASSFTYRDLTLTLQGSPNVIDTSSVVITRLDSVSFSLDISKLTNGNGLYTFTVQAAEVSDIYGIKGITGKQVSWSQFLDVPTIEAFLAIPANRTARAFDTIQVLFNLPLDIATVTPARFTIFKDSIQQAGNLTIDSVRADNKLFYLSGLKNILVQPGAYQLKVDLLNIQSADHKVGMKEQSVTLIVDNAGPLVITLEKSNTGGLDSQHVTFVQIRFNEDVKGFNTAAVRLSRNGDPILLGIDQLSNTDLSSWMAGNFGTLTYPEGSYVFIIQLDSVKDGTGNYGTGTAQVAWTVNRSGSIVITNLSVIPDLGFSKTDGITSGQSLNISFHLSENASKVTILQTDVSGELVLINLSAAVAGDVSVPVTISKGGNTGIRIRAASANGGITTADKVLFIDETPLSAQWLFAAGQSIPVQVDTISLALSSKMLSDSGFLNAISLSRNGSPLPANALHYTPLNDTSYMVYGIRQVGIRPGNYQISFDPQAFNKYSSGKEGVLPATTSWTVLSDNHAPIAKSGNDTTITAPGMIVLNGTGSSDPDADSITYRWVALPGIVLSDSTSATPSFTVSTTNPGSKYTFLLIVSDGSLFSTDVVNVTVLSGLPANDLLVAAKVFLQGPYNGGLMIDSLRAKSLLPVTDPYPSLGFIHAGNNAAATVNGAVFNNAGNTAIVDWIWVELRNSANPAQVVATRSALVHKDGNITDLDGISPVRFSSVPEAAYYVAIRHRNHLGIMTQSTLVFNNNSAVTIDFSSPSTATYGSDARFNQNGIMLMWAGDANGDWRVNYNGVDNDKNAVLAKAGMTTSNNVLVIYDRADVNMDGKVKYNGASNDKNAILSAVGLNTPNRIITEQLPN